jgi:hypothetical protein
MATQQEAMDQVKEVVRLMIKYRFWIAVGIAALFGVIAYFVGAGPVRQKADEETKKIKAAENDVKQYTSPAIPTRDYKPIVLEKTGVMTGDVNSAWKLLYDRQAPLLTWPERVQERFRKWGREWPANEDRGKVNLAIVDYIEAYKAYVDMVYKTCKPFDFESGQGIVVAPPEENLLQPAVFAPEHLPGLSAVWSAQERLWIQRTMLEVVAQVNKNAKDWNSAIVKQIDALEVGSSIAQDQRSVAKGETLKEAPLILAPGETAPDPAGGGGAAASGGVANAPGAGGAGRLAMMTGPRSGGGGGGAGGSTDPQTVFYVQSGNEAQYKILPVMITVLIDQDRVQDFLVELENSPMAIQVMDFELLRPSARVVKPEKGGDASGSIGMSMMGGMGGGIGGMGAYAGRISMMQSQMMSMQRGQQGNMAGAMSAMMRGGMGGGAAAEKKKGTDVRSVDTKAQRVKREKAAADVKGPSYFDPYFDIVQVTVYGQARFFNPPPAQPEAAPSPGDTTGAAAAAPATPAAPADAPAKAAVTPAAAGALPKTEAAPEKGQAAPAAAEPKGDTPAEPAKSADPAQPAEAAPKPDAAATPKAGPAPATKTDAPAAAPKPSP